MIVKCIKQKLEEIMNLRATKKPPGVLVLAAALWSLKLNRLGLTPDGGATDDALTSALEGARFCCGSFTAKSEPTEVLAPEVTGTGAPDPSTEALLFADEASRFGAGVEDAVVVRLSVFDKLSFNPVED